MNDDEIEIAQSVVNSHATTLEETRLAAQGAAADDDAAQTALGEAQAQADAAAAAYGSDPGATTAKALHASGLRAAEARARAAHTARQKRETADGAASATRAHADAAAKLEAVKARRNVATLRADISGDVKALATAMLEARRLARKIDARAGEAAAAVKALAASGSPLDPAACGLGVHLVLVDLLRAVGGDELAAAHAPKSSGNGIAFSWLAEDYRPGEVERVCTAPLLSAPVPVVNEREDRLATIEASLGHHSFRAHAATLVRPETPKLGGPPPGSRYSIDQGRARFADGKRGKVL